MKVNYYKKFINSKLTSFLHVMPLLQICCLSREECTITICCDIPKTRPKDSKQNLTSWLMRGIKSSNVDSYTNRFHIHMHLYSVFRISQLSTCRSIEQGKCKQFYCLINELFILVNGQIWPGNKNWCEYLPEGHC